MTYLTSVIALAALALPVIAAQRSPGADEEVTVRGCLYFDTGEHVLRANEEQYQSLNSPGWVDWGQRFVLGGDGDLLGQLRDHDRHEVEVTGQLSLPGPSSTAIVERGGPGGTPQGLSNGPFGARLRPGRSTSGRDQRGFRDVTFLLATAFEHISLECRQ